MEIRVLRYFLTVAREENITKAAELLHITQPTLSRQLMQLEEELGVKLFHRSNHKINLTEDGMLLKKRAQDIVALTDRTTREFAAKYEEGLSGEIVLGSGETKNMHLLARLVADFRAAHPQVQFDFYTANADDVKERLDRGLIDIGLLTEPVDISRYHFIRLPYKERWGVLLREDSPLAQKTEIVPEDLAGVPLLVAGRPSVKNELEGWFGEVGGQLQIAGTYNLVNNAAVMVENGVGAALCFPLGNIYEHLKFIPLSPRVETGAVVVWKKERNLSRAAECFLEALRQYLKSISE
ncbi:MAG: LysR family transcriptional regulator [Eubacterium sp.]|nr:LysR family transcriptional regulator [Eubacterium sp.]